MCHFEQKLQNTHFELIQKAFEFIKDPAAFYAEEEKHPGGETE